jgi:signal peptidase I
LPFVTLPPGTDVEPPPPPPPPPRPGRGPVRKPPARGSTRHLVEWIVLVVAALLVALLIKTFLFQAFWIPSDSMIPTLVRGDRVLVNKLSYKVHDVHRGDIVVFTAPEEEQGIKDLIKRVIGLPSETIEGRNGRIYIDGHRLDEPYLPKGTVSRSFPARKVPANSYFMLGDNRLGSKDSIFFGPIPKREIVGRAFVRFWPLGRFGFM